MKKLCTKSIFLAEGENHVREALRLMLENQPEFALAGEAGNSESLLAQVCRRPPGVILLDWHLPGLHPQRLLAALRQCCPETLILATSVRPEQRQIVQEYAVDGFLSKQIPPDDFVAALKGFVAGWYDEEWLPAMFEPDFSKLNAYDDSVLGKVPGEPR